MELAILLYTAFMLCVVVACIIVIFHLRRYSLDKKIANITTVLFILVTLILTIITTVFFVQIPFEQLQTY